MQTAAAESLLKIINENEQWAWAKSSAGVGKLDAALKDRLMQGWSVRWGSSSSPRGAGVVCAMELPKGACVRACVDRVWQRACACAVCMR
eukprot:15455607-Alexandrium_andersonii.AAC.1